MRKRKKSVKAKIVTTVAIASNNGLLREGLFVMLGSLPGHKVVSEVSSGLDLLKAISKNQTQLVLMECELPGLTGIDTLIRVKNEFPETKVILLCSWNNTECIKKFIRHGCNGLLIGVYNFETLIKAINAVTSNKFYSNVRQHGSTIRKIRKQKAEQPSYNQKLLTEREREVLTLIYDEKSYTQISRKLFISPRTVERHRENIFIKTGVKSSIGLVKYAVKNGIV